MKFGLIGDGKIAIRHKHAVEQLGGKIIRIHDPRYGNDSDPLNEFFFWGLDYVIICSPSFMHREHIKLCLRWDKRIICEDNSTEELPIHTMEKSSSKSATFSTREISVVCSSMPP